MDIFKLLSNVLYIDLTKKIFWTESREDLFSKWLGGIGVATQLYKEEVEGNIDPLGPENVIVFAVGPLTGVYPLASKTIAVFKSPLTNYFAESHAGGRSALAIRFAGYSAIVIKGASDRPIYIVIDDEKVRFRDASVLWGMRSTETVGGVLREVTAGAGHRTIMRIGRAGERLVRYASVVTETYRHFGRLGLGAVFGSKKLKALVIVGRRGFKVPNVPAYREVYEEVYSLAVKSLAMKKYHDLGTAANVLTLNSIKALPTRNFSSGYFEAAEEISGERLAETVLARRVACAGCPTACVHLAALREPYPEEPYFYKIKFVSYDYEPLYALGSNLGIKSREGFLKLVDVVEEEGLDAISTGVVLAWATEAYINGLISEKELLTRVNWGDYEAYIKVVRNIVMQPNEFYKTLALGVEEAAKRYGGLDYALAFNKVELAGYHTGPLYHISLLIGFRHSHLDAGAYSMDEEILVRGKQLPTPEEAVKRIVEEESWRQVLNSLVVCLFARGIYRPETVTKCFKPLNVEYTVEQLKELGRKIWLEKQLIKKSEGFNPLELRIPRRVLETPTSLGRIDEGYIKEALKHFNGILSTTSSETK
ncbi:MAG: aldehyde ferredoxin oxidoreductase family protein [Desulfurococcaceae archaeon]